MIRITPDGYFTRHGQPCVPVGVNYWPASAGVEMWAQWPEEEIRHDLALVARLGLNTVRFFLRWQDFEPEPGQYDETMFARLADMLRWGAQEGLLLQPTLFVGFMSGGIFWPAWKGQRNLYADPTMRARAIAFARRVATLFRPFADHLIGIDLGNEMNCLPEHSSATREEIRAWSAEVAAALRETCPALLVMIGNEQGQFCGDTGWRIDDAAACFDYLSMHGYPVATWMPVQHDGMTDPLCQGLLPDLVAMARTWGPVMLQEFGTILTGGQTQQEAYLRALLPAAWQAGANGFLWWCLRDITAPMPPYTHGPFESQLGLIDAEDRIKPGLAYYLTFAREVATWPLPSARPDLLIYLPEQYYGKGNPLNPGNGPYQSCRNALIAAYLLRRTGATVGFTFGSQPLPASSATLFLPGIALTTPEMRRLAEWVADGGTLIWHGLPWQQACPAAEALLGARFADLNAPVPLIVDAWGDQWRFQGESEPRPLLEPVTADVLGHDQFGRPQVLRHRYGQGSVLGVIPRVEQTIASHTGARQTRDAWAAWYANSRHAVRVTAEA